MRQATVPMPDLWLYAIGMLWLYTLFNTGVYSQCPSGMYGPTCKINTGNVVIGKPAEMGPHIKSQSAAGNAVDGNTDQTCNYAWSDKQNKNGYTWWWVNLTDVYTIYKITILFYTSTDPTDNDILKKRVGFSLFVSNTSDTEQPSSNLCYQDLSSSAAESELIAVVSLTNCSSSGQYIHIVNTRNKSLNLTYPSDWPNLQITEVEVIAETGCSAGTYGPQCDSVCGCDACNRTTGACSIIEGVCYWPTEFQGNTFYDNAHEILVFTRTTMTGISFTAGGSTVENWECLDDTAWASEKTLILKSTDTFTEAGSTWVSYLCLKFTEVSVGNSYYYYQYHDAESNASNERVYISNNGTLTSKAAICSASSVPNSTFHFIVKQNAATAAKQYCPPALLAKMGYVHTDAGGAATCDVSTSNWDVCTDRMVMTFNYTACSREMAYSTAGEVWCMATITSTYEYVVVYNTDSSPAFRFICFVVSANGTTASMVYDQCRENQTPTTLAQDDSGADIGALLTMTPTDTCRCGPVPTVDNGVVTADNIGTTASVNCTSCYEANPGTSVVCLPDGTWTPVTCDVIACPSPTATPNVSAILWESVDCGRKAFVICDSGYEPVNESITCEADSTWSADPTCELNEQAWNETCSIDMQCTGDNQVCCGGMCSCEDTFTYDGTECVMDCGTPPDTPNANTTVDVPGVTTGGSTATVSCESCYTGSGTITCNPATGIWSSASCTIKNCPVIMPGDLHNGSAVLCDSPWCGQKALVVCDPGYSAVNSTITCGNDSQWDALPVCVLDVQVLGDPCTVNAQCTGPNQICSDEKCSCDGGYAVGPTGDCEIETKTTAASVPGSSSSPISATPGSSSGGSSTDTTPIVAGVIVGVLAAAVIVAVIIYCIKKKMGISPGHFGKQAHPDRAMTNGHTPHMTVVETDSQL